MLACYGIACLIMSHLYLITQPVDDGDLVIRQVEEAAKDLVKHPVDSDQSVAYTMDRGSHNISFSR